MHAWSETLPSNATISGCNRSRSLVQYLFILAKLPILRATIQAKTKGQVLPAPIHVQYAGYFFLAASAFGADGSFRLPPD